MKRSVTIVILLSLIGILSALDQLTVYNQDLALVRTTVKLQLSKGAQDYNFSDITSSIQPASVIITPLQKKFTLLAQNFEYDLANTEKVMGKYLGKEIELRLKTGQELVTGTLQFADFNTIGLTDKNTNKFLMITKSEISDIRLPSLPNSFYLQPTLHWELSAPDKGEYQAVLSYLTGGLSWDVTYNAVWDDKNIQLNSWVTLNNASGKAFENTTLKLIAGDVNKIQREVYENASSALRAYKGGADDAPSFTQQEFNDLHLYTLSEPVSVQNNQIKQLMLYPTKTVAAKASYEYVTNSDKVKTQIKFMNSEATGLGLPLPKGVIKVYRRDVADGNLEFVGEDKIDHTPINEELTIDTGSAFDLVAKTIVADSRQISNFITDRDMVVTLKNNSKETRTILIKHYKSQNTKISNTSLPMTTKSASEVNFTKELRSGEEYKLTWTERS